MTISLLRQWILTPISNYRLFHNFTKQDFFGQFAASIGGFLWLFLTPVVQIITYAFVFRFVFGIRGPEEFGEASFVIFMVISTIIFFALSKRLNNHIGSDHA
jgi:lipopolysaccharide transport system permease protein